MTDTSQGPGSWQASDGKWYPAEQHPGVQPPPVFPYPYFPPRPPSTNGLAIASLVLALVPIFGVGAILAIIFGFIARRQIRESGGTEGGAGMALAGIIVGICQLVLAVVGIVIIAIVVSTTVPRAVSSIDCQRDANRVQIALENYHAVNHSYPAVLTPWSHHTYVINFTPLTNTATGSPLLTSAPPTDHYVIEFDADGHVWIEAPGQYDAVYNSAGDVGNAGACFASTR